MHLRKAELAREKLKAAKEECKVIPNLYSFTFDLQKALPFPVLTCSSAYYKRNCYIYNLGCHELSSGNGFMYVWEETTASRGAQEISSCILEHLRKKAGGSSHVVMFSDSCGGQNRNIKVSLAILRFLQEDHNIHTIDHKFMASGHSYLPNDGDFGSIEQFAKGKTVYVPENWHSIITKCRRKKPFHLKVMAKEDFFSTKPLEEAITRRQKNETGGQVQWLKIQWLRYKKDEPFKIFYKTTLNDDVAFEQINIEPSKQKARGRPLSSLKSVQMEVLYPNGRATTDQKKKDMLDLLPFIPPIHHNYFVHLPVGHGLEEDNPIIDRNQQSGDEEDVGNDN